MNYKKLGQIIGKIMILESILMIAPLIVSFIYQESLKYQLSFLIPIVLLVGIGSLLQLLKPKYNIRFNGYRIEGDPIGFDYQVYDNQDKKVMSFYKESIFRKNYCLKINDEMNEEICVLITIATLMGGK